MTQSFKEEEGGAVVELGFVLPVLMLMIVGAMQMGVVLFGYCSASFGVRAAARYACLHSSSSLVPAPASSIQAVAAPYLTVGSQASAASVSTTYSTTNVVGGTVTVKAQVTYNVTLPFTAQKTITVATQAERLIVH